MSKIHSSVAIITAYDIKSQQVEQVKFNPHHLVLWSFLGLSQWVLVFYIKKNRMVRRHAPFDNKNVAPCIADVPFFISSNDP